MTMFTQEVGMRDGTKAVYRLRILEALDYIEDHLDEDPSIPHIAEAAHFSPFHFCRVFRATTGETPGGLVKRLRLERAAFRLRTGPEPMMLIALRAGYDSNSSFTRAFSAAFGETPSQFRALRRSLPCLPAPSGYHYCPEKGIRAFEPVTEGGNGVEGRLVDLEPMKVLCVRHTGPYNQIGEAFQRLGDLVTRSGMDVSRSQWLAIYHDDQDTTDQASLRSDACVSIEGDDPLPSGEGVTVLDIPGGDYATTRHIGSYSMLGKVWGEFVGAWIPASGYRPRHAHCFEIYVKGHGDGCPESEFITDIYEPVDPL